MVVTGLNEPTPGVDYPSSWPQFRSWFPDDEACAGYLEKLRWPEGFVCPHCGHRHGWRTGTGAWLCSSCRARTSTTSGTIFHGSRHPLTTWFAAVWYVTSTKTGVSAAGLRHALGLGSYETAWAWLHKLRRTMVRPDRERLDGLVEVDETYINTKASTPRDGRGTAKPAVVIAVEMRTQPDRLGRTRLRYLPELSQHGLLEFIDHTIAPGVTVRTDGWNVYQPLATRGYRHQPINVVRSGEPAHIAMPGVHRVAALLKRWLAGTLHHSVSDKHLPYYLDEFTFRFNRRNARHRGMLFYRLLQQAVNTDPHPLHSITAEDLDPYIWG